MFPILEIPVSTLCDGQLKSKQQGHSTIKKRSEHIKEGDEKMKDQLTCIKSKRAS